jgi:TRAP-type transport system small permease protein
MRWLIKADHFIERLEKFILSTSILLMAFNSIANVLGRYLFNQSIHFSEELNHFLIIFITFSGSAYAARQGRHITMTAFIEQLHGKLHSVALVLTAAGSTALLATLTFYAVVYIEKVHHLERTSAALQIPMHYIYLLVPLGLGMTTLQYFRQTCSQILTLTRETTDTTNPPPVN